MCDDAVVAARRVVVEPDLQSFMSYRYSVLTTVRLSTIRVGGDRGRLEVGRGKGRSGGSHAPPSDRSPARATEKERIHTNNHSVVPFSILELYTQRERVE